MAWLEVYERWRRLPPLYCESVSWRAAKWAIWPCMRRAAPGRKTDDQRDRAGAPAYDFVATTPYLPEDKLALSFGGSKTMDGIAQEQIRRLADRARLPVNPLWTIVKEMSARVVEAWRSLPAKDLLPAAMRDTISRQIERAAL